MLTEPIIIAATIPIVEVKTLGVYITANPIVSTKNSAIIICIKIGIRLSEFVGCMIKKFEILLSVTRTYHNGIKKIDTKIANVRINLIKLPTSGG